MNAGARSALPGNEVARLAARYSRSNFPALEATMKAARASINPGALEQLRSLDTVGKPVMRSGRAEEQLKAFDLFAGQVQMAERLRPQLQRLVEGNMPLNSWRRGLNSPAPAELAALGGVKASTGLNQEIVKAGERLMASTNFSEQLKSRFEEISKDWSAASRLTDLYSQGKSTRLNQQLTGLSAAATARLSDKYSFGGPLAKGALTEATRRHGLFPSFDHAQARKIAEQHLQLMPSWSAAEMARMKVGINDLARLGAPRPGQLAATTLAQLVSQRAGTAMKPSTLSPELASAVRSLVRPAPRLNSGVLAPAPVETVEVEAPAPAARPQPENHEIAPLAAGSLAQRNRQKVVAFFEHAGLATELEHLEAIEERLRRGSKPALIHIAVSARWVLKGVADRFYPARGQHYVCRFDCPHKVGVEEIANRVSAFVDERLRSDVDTHTQKQFQATLDWVYRWGGRGTHEHRPQAEALKGYLWLLEVLAMVASAYEVEFRARLKA